MAEVLAQAVSYIIIALVMILWFPIMTQHCKDIGISCCAILQYRAEFPIEFPEN